MKHVLQILGAKILRLQTTENTVVLLVQLKAACVVETLKM